MKRRCLVKRGPVIAPLKTAKECFYTLSNLYEKKVPSQKRVLKNKLRTLKMEKDDYVASFFTKISQLRDQLLVIGITIDDRSRPDCCGWSSIFLGDIYGRDKCL